MRLTPRASREEIAGPRGDALAVKVMAPALEDRANHALCRLIAKRLGVASGRVELARGKKGRDKILRVRGIGAAEAAERLA